ncbi:MAG: arginine--tRNA ligase [Burkholderiales bacterium]|nr:arginine--tRNA ligase [Burkholderiales bacterium]OJX06253.1 MAG: arginine--tRNA ligase [Burkholderiales bacterium 70-64]
MLPEQNAQLAALFREAAARTIAQAGVAVAMPPIELERPRQAEHGDLACNLALQLARPLKANPRRIAEQLKAAVEALDRAPGAVPLVESLEIAGPGFLNLRLRPEAKRAAIGRVLREGAAFGRGERGAQRRVMVEFVSANPTGPLHVGHGRQGALGDALAALLEADGWRVTREFYYNDAGAQIDKLALSVQARARGIEPEDERFPADGYRGEYIRDISADYLARRSVAAEHVAEVAAAGDPDDLDAIRRFAVAYLRHEQDIDLRAFGVHFDNFYLESSLYAEGRVQATVEALARAGKTYEDGGALWLRTTEYGDDKDRVMRKSDGTYTYFVPDVAYHVVKWQRGFARAINVQGSDHHGTIARVRAGLQALGAGIPPGYPDYVLHKMVTVMRGGEEVKISKRAGSYVTLRDLINWTGEAREGDAVYVDEQRGRDAVRFFLVSRKADSEFVFDVDLALARTDENPVYYIQYAHARICSVLAQWGGDAAALAAAAGVGRLDLGALEGEREFALAARLAAFPGMLATAVDELAPHTVAFYLKDLAAELHSYYNAERVLVDDEGTRNARLALLLATRQVLRNGLALIGVSAPERM